MQALPLSPEASAGKAQQILQPGVLPAAVAALLWRGDQLGRAAATVVPTGFAALDAELPGGGWPCGTLTELLQPQPSVAEWRLLGPALGRLAATGRTVALVGPPKPPHPPGLAQAGIDPARLLWLQADTPAERLWCAEQLAGCAGCAVVAWLPQARPSRSAACSSSSRAPTTCCSSAGRPLPRRKPRLRRCGCRWRSAPAGELQVRVLKRRGPSHDGALALRSVPGRLDAVLPPRSQPQPAQRPASVLPCHAGDRRCCGRRCCSTRHRPQPRRPLSPTATATAARQVRRIARRSPPGACSSRRASRSPRPTAW